MVCVPCFIIPVILFFWRQVEKSRFSVISFVYFNFNVDTFHVNLILAIIIIRWLIQPYFLKYIYNPFIKKDETGKVIEEGKEK